MLNSENMSEAARSALVHSGIEAGNEDDILAHYGVEGMKWGRRKADRAERKAGGGRITTLLSVNKKPVLSVVKRTSPASQLASNVKTATANAKAKRDKLKKATDKMWDDAELNDNFGDYRSTKTKRIGRANVITSLASLGAVGAFFLSKNPKTKKGAVAIAALLTTSGFVLDEVERKSNNKDILKKYGED